MTEKKVVTVTEEKTTAACCLEDILQATEEHNATPKQVGKFYVERRCCGTWDEVVCGSITEDARGQLTVTASLPEGWGMEALTFLSGMDSLRFRIEK